MIPQMRVSIGMPVFNAERHLAESIDSLLAQDHENLELIISDNASTDGTESICRSYAARDARVRYYRAEQNRGAVWNFNRVLELALGDCFIWAAHDDLRAPHYVSRCVAVLDQQPDAVLCCTDVSFIDLSGQAVQPWKGLAGIRPVGRTAGDRARAIARARCWWDYYGLIRTRILRETRGAQPVWGFDVVLLMELCLRGPVAHIPEPLFIYRIDREKTTAQMATTLASDASAGAVPVNWSAMAIELATSIWISRLAAPRRVELMLEFLVRFCILNGQTGAGMRKDALPTAAGFWSERRYGKAVALVLLAAVVVPVQTRLGRGSYNLIRRLARTRHSPA
jgi:glycosyltransferase involved in cell wall biosynthesis